MVEEKYYLVERVRDCFGIDATNMNLVKQTGKGLEVLSNSRIEPKEIGIELNENGKIFCTDDKYEVNEITEETSHRIMQDMLKNYSLWREYLSGTGNRASPPLITRFYERLS